jgi:hypothetical protein
MSKKTTVPKTKYKIGQIIYYKGYPETIEEIRLIYNYRGLAKIEYKIADRFSTIEEDEISENKDEASKMRISELRRDVKKYKQYISEAEKKIKMLS